MAQRFVGQPGGRLPSTSATQMTAWHRQQLQQRETSKRLVLNNNQLALLDSDYKAAHCRRYAGRATVRADVQLARVLQGVRVRDPPVLVLRLHPF